MPSRKSESNYRNPVPTVDLIIQIKTPRGEDGIILIKRNNPPPGWALPGGFVDYGESLEQAAVREAEEETSLKVRLVHQFHTYSDPGRDPRKHTITTVFLARARGVPVARDDAGDIGIFTRREIDFPLAFDHRRILDDYFRFVRKAKRRSFATEVKGRAFAAEKDPRVSPGPPDNSVVKDDLVDSVVRDNLVVADVADAADPQTKPGAPAAAGRTPKNSIERRGRRHGQTRS